MFCVVWYGGNGKNAKSPCCGVKNNKNGGFLRSGAFFCGFYAVFVYIGATGRNVIV